MPSGESFAFGDSEPSLFRQPLHALACDSGGKGPPGLLESDRACLDYGDVFPAGFLTHHARSAGIVQRSERGERLLLLTNHDSERPDSVEASHLVCVAGVLSSTRPSSASSFLGMDGLEDTASVLPSRLQTSCACVRQYEGTEACTFDIEWHGCSSGDHMLGKVSSCLAWPYFTGKDRSFNHVTVPGGGICPPRPKPENIQNHVRST